MSDNVRNLIDEARELLNDHKYGYLHFHDGDLVERLADALESVTAKIEKVRAIHQRIELEPYKGRPSFNEACDFCSEDRLYVPWPCPTIEAVGETDE